VPDTIPRSAHTVPLCVSYGSGHKGDHFPTQHYLNGFCITKTESVYYAVRNESLNVTQVDLRLQRVKNKALPAAAVTSHRNGLSKGYKEICALKLRWTHRYDLHAFHTSSTTICTEFYEIPTRGLVADVGSHTDGWTWSTHKAFLCTSQIMAKLTHAFHEDIQGVFLLRASRA
jgi:hypothetical protein